MPDNYRRGKIPTSLSGTCLSTLKLAKIPLLFLESSSFILLTELTFVSEIDSRTNLLKNIVKAK